MTIQFLTPVGRLVQGNVFQGETKDMNGNPRLTRDGQPKTNFFVGLAVPKAKAAPLLEAIKSAASEFRNGEDQLPHFAWKYVDGDSTMPNQAGNKPCDQEGFAGCYVFRFNTGRAPKVYDMQNNELIDQRSIKLGDYVRVAGTVKANGSDRRPGVYLSHNAVQLVDTGPEIAKGVDYASVFAQQPVDMPAGATPTAPAPHDPVPPAPSAPPPAPTAPAAPAGPRMAPGCPYTYDALKSRGWTDDQMRAEGWLL